jgi:hypothetical protein
MEASCEFYTDRAHRMAGQAARAEMITELTNIAVPTIAGDAQLPDARKTVCIPNKNKFVWVSSAPPR